MSAPTATVGDASDLLDVDMDHVSGALGNDALRLAVWLPARIDESAPVQPELRQDARDRAAADRDTYLRQLELDSRRRPFVLATHPPDLCDHRALCRVGLA
jgi:hypothetical protein